MNSSNLMDFSVLEDEENQFKAPPLAQTPVVKNSILKPSTKDNLIQLNTPIHKNLKVKFQTPQPVKTVTPKRYEVIREMDDKENWVERTTVVLKSDHEENVINAQAILLEVIDESIYRSETRSDEVPEIIISDTSNSLSDKQTGKIEDSCPKTTGEICLTPSMGKTDSEDTSNILNHAKENVESSPALPVKTGAYSIDFDNLDSVDPFKTSGGLVSSPSTEPCKTENDECIVEKTGVSDDLLDKLEDIDIELIEDKGSEDLDVAENKHSSDADVTVIENKHTAEADLTVIENKRSADADVTVIENKKTDELDTTVTDINVNNMDLDKIENPFATKTQLVNSPALSKSGTENPFAALKMDFTPTDTSKSDIVEENCSSKISEEKVLDVNVECSLTVTVNKENTQNSDVNPSSIDKTTTSQELDSEENPFATKSKVPNSPTIASEENPFATKSNIQNSPTIPSEQNPFATKTKVPNSPMIASEENPFATKSNVPNSPTIASDDYPCATKSNVPNLPTSAEENPFATKSNIKNSPTMSSEENPFATKSKVPNSPTIASDENPFATKTKVPNSPTIASEENPFATKTKVPNSPTIALEENPFATKTKVPNSPTVALEENPFATKTKVPNSPTIASEENPFATKTKVPNSPTIASEENPFATKTKVPNSPTIASEENPFATNSKVANSPNIASEENLLATKSKVPNSPIIASEENPFATKSKVPISPTIASEENPFATKSKVPNSPAVSADENPFASMSKVPNSPAIASDENPFATKAIISNSPTKKIDNIDPFEISCKMSNSPTVAKSDAVKNVNEEKVAAKDPFSPQVLSGNITAKKDVKDSIPKSADGFDNLGIDEDQFKPASDVFNDTAAWDMLESFGSSTADSASALSRQSLYVKFDPLVNLPPDDPRRASMDFRRASMKLERLRELNAEESFLLFGTPPKTSGVRSVGVVPHVPGEGGAKRKTPAKTPVQEVKRSALDLLSDSPDVLSMSIDVNRLGEHAEGLKMNMADIQETDNDIVEVLKYTDADLKKMQHQILMEVQGKVLSSEREFALLKQTFEKEMKQKQEEFQKELTAREEKAKKNAQSFDEMMVILTEYEKTIDNLINEKEKLKEEKDEEISKMKKKIEQLSTDEESVETAFSDLARRYDKLKTALQGYKNNEETLKKYIDECTAKIKTTEEKMLTLKKDAETKLKKVLSDNETLKSELETESSKFKVSLKRKEMELQSVQNQLEQKIKENTELTNLCDELVAKVK